MVRLISQLRMTPFLPLFARPRGFRPAVVRRQPPQPGSGTQPQCPSRQRRRGGERQRGEQTRASPRPPRPRCPRKKVLQKVRGRRIQIDPQQQAATVTPQHPRADRIRHSEPGEGAEEEAKPDHAASSWLSLFAASRLDNLSIRCDASSFDNESRSGAQWRSPSSLTSFAPATHSS